MHREGLCASRLVIWGGNRKVNTTSFVEASQTEAGQHCRWELWLRDGKRVYLKGMCMHACTHTHTHTYTHDPESLFLLMFALFSLLHPYLPIIFWGTQFWGSSHPWRRSLKALWRMGLRTSFPQPHQWEAHSTCAKTEHNSPWSQNHSQPLLKSVPIIHSLCPFTVTQLGLRLLFIKGEQMKSFWIELFILINN